ncbi:MAG: hypothetical protein KKG09_10225 [Verrucomicrobia bacterium]|nr:hypothetical protein [Verrucomicrobiota bacterium]MCG2681863.1 hypothetical protein [Kiritimatiellia bacterium]MBU4247743.1 hypothetical protein [Verrucomicrobiota bacterium]MBU4291605.1 hypothetical protein [Verrucomicrobiota bacterium]MBU4428597.1 hypothetical protein [Verrucomicrobiota bacterium]
MIAKMKVSRKRSCCGREPSVRADRSVCLLDRQCEEYASRHTPALGSRTNIPGAVIRRRPVLSRGAPDAAPLMRKDL